MIQGRSPEEAKPITSSRDSMSPIETTEAAPICHSSSINHNKNKNHKNKTNQSIIISNGRMRITNQARNAKLYNQG